MMACLSDKEIKTIEQQAIKDEYRLAYHLMPPIGWLNDPNGLCQYHGVYHIYYQYSPDNCRGGDKYWGHYSTKDFITFKNEPVALYPDTKEDQSGVYSGSAIVANDQIYYYYTGNVKHPGNHDYIHTGREHNTMMVLSQDGINLKNKICLMKNSDYPTDVTLHVRDPQVIKKGDHYLMILGARQQDDVGCCLLYRSIDLKQFELINRISTTKPFGYMWECPNLVELKGQMILFCCPQGVKKIGYNYENIYQNGYFIVDGDIEKEYTLSEFVEFDHGFDFYAPQLFKDENKRTIIIGWMGLPDVPYTNPTVDYHWQHALTLPRQLTYRNGKVYQYPINETKKLRKSKKDVKIKNNQKITCNTNVFELYLPVNNHEFEIKLRSDASITYHDHLLTLSMKESGYGRDARHIVIDNFENMTIFSDVSSLEIFINNGEYALTTRIYDHSKQLEISIDTSILCSYYELNSYKII